MPSIDFYYISGQGNQAGLFFACRLLEKAYRQKHLVYVLIENPEKAQLLNNLLWAFRDDSFIPHQLINNAQDLRSSSPIQISHQVTTTPHQDILLNCHATIPDFHEQFNRILEIVTQDPDLQQIAEEHRVFYEKKGYKISSHQL